MSYYLANGSKYTLDELLNLSPIEKKFLIQAMETHQREQLELEKIKIEALAKMMSR